MAAVWRCGGILWRQCGGGVAVLSSMGYYQYVLVVWGWGSSMGVV